MRRNVLLFSLFAVATATLPAQQILHFEIAGSTQTSGLDAFGFQSRIRVVIRGEGEVTLEPTRGFTPAQIASALFGQLSARGFSASLLPGNIVSVYSTQKPLGTQGGVIACTDTGLEGVSVAVREGTPANPQLLPNKRSGCSIPNLRPGRTVAPGQLTILVDVDRPAALGGAYTATVNVPVFANEWSSGVDTRTVDALGTAGLRASFVLNQSIVDPAGWVQGIAIDRDAQGNPVRRVTYLPQIQTELVQMELTAGALPDVSGITHYDRDHNGAAHHFPLLDSNLPPFLGAPLDLVLQSDRPGRLAAIFVGVDPVRLPMPFLAPEAHLLVTPLAVLDGVTDGGGSLVHMLQIPLDPALAGQLVCFQGLDVGFFGGDFRLSDGLAVRLGP